MLNMLAAAASRCAPMANVDGSLNSVPPPADAGGAGDGVAGALVVVLVEGAGAAGAAGVFVDVAAGVEGALVAEDDVAGAVLG